jgi:hypothetical protein
VNQDIFIIPPHHDGTTIIDKRDGSNVGAAFGVQKVHFETTIRNRPAQFAPGTGCAEWIQELVIAETREEAETAVTRFSGDVGVKGCSRDSRECQVYLVKDGKFTQLLRNAFVLAVKDAPDIDNPSGSGITEMWFSDREFNQSEEERQTVAAAKVECFRILGRE